MQKKLLVGWGKRKKASLGHLLAGSGQDWPMQGWRKGGKSTWTEEPPECRSDPSKQVACSPKGGGGGGEKGAMVRKAKEKARWGEKSQREKCQSNNPQTLWLSV